MTTKKKETVNQATMVVSNRRIGTLFGVRLTMTSSTANKNEIAATRTLASHVSHARSLNFISPISACSYADTKRRVAALSGERGDHREQRHIERDHDTADDNA